MKLTKDKQIEALTLSIQQLLQENTELKNTLQLLKEDTEFSYRDGYDAGAEDVDESYHRGYNDGYASCEDGGLM